MEQNQQNSQNHIGFVLMVLYVLLEKKNDGYHSNKESIPRP